MEGKDFKGFLVFKIPKCQTGVKDKLLMSVFENEFYSHIFNISFIPFF